MVTFVRLNYVGRPIYQLGVSFFKIALLISYLRLLKGTDRTTYRKVIKTTMALVFLAHLGCSLALIFACSPVRRPKFFHPLATGFTDGLYPQIQESWNPAIAGNCLPTLSSFMAYSLITIVSDVIVIVLPVPLLLKLNMSLNKKIGLVVMLLLGLFTTLCSVFRCLQIRKISNGNGNSTLLVLWGVIEFNVGVSLGRRAENIRSVQADFMCLLQNIVSSLPFLMRTCVAKIQNLRSRPTTNAGTLAVGWGSNEPGGHRHRRCASCTDLDMGSEGRRWQEHDRRASVWSIAHSV